MEGDGSLASPVIVQRLLLCKRGIGGNGPPFDQCRDTLSPATYKEKRHMINHHGSKMDKEVCKCGGNYGPPFDQCRDTLSPATYKEKRHMINHHGSKMDKEVCKCGGNYGPPFNQCRDTLPAATHKETAYDQSSCFKNGQGTHKETVYDHSTAPVSTRGCSYRQNIKIQ